MKLKALVPFVSRNGADGKLTSHAPGEIFEASSETGAALISEGLAEAYTLITPTGTKTITVNGTSDISEYANVTVNVPAVKLEYNKNGGTGTNPSTSYVGAGTSVTLASGSAYTPPEGKQFKGWGLTADATEVVGETYAPNENTTLYAVWEDAAAE